MKKDNKQSDIKSMFAKMTSSNDKKNTPLKEDKIGIKRTAKQAYYYNFIKFN
jgi:hypothetical protein